MIDSNIMLYFIQCLTQLYKINFKELRVPQSNAITISIGYESMLRVP